MESFIYTINAKLGIHAFPASRLVQISLKHFSKVYVVNSIGKEADMKNIFMLLGLEIKCGDTISIVADGDDEFEAISNIKQFFIQNL